MRLILPATIALLAASIALPSAAQEWPAKPVRLVAPFSAGGASDTLGRLIAEGLTKALGQQFLGLIYLTPSQSQSGFM